MTADILLCSEDPVFSRMLSLELSSLSLRTEIRSAISQQQVTSPLSRKNGKGGGLPRFERSAPVAADFEGITRR